MSHYNCRHCEVAEQQGFTHVHQPSKSDECTCNFTAPDCKVPGHKELVEKMMEDLGKFQERTDDVLLEVYSAGMEKSSE